MISKYQQYVSKQQVQTQDYSNNDNGNTPTHLTLRQYRALLHKRVMEKKKHGHPITPLPPPEQRPLSTKRCLDNSVEDSGKKRQERARSQLPKEYLSKFEWNIHDIQQSPIEKTIRMLDKILSGEKGYHPTTFS